MSFKAHLFLFVVLCVFPMMADAQGADWSSPASGAHQLILEYQLQKADSALEHVEAVPEKTYLLALREFLELMYTEDKVLYQNYLEKSSVRKEIFESLMRDDPWRNFYLADLILQESLIRIRNGDYLSGLYDLWQANRLLANTTVASSQGFLPVYKTKGVINLLVGLAPDNYKWALELIGLGGTIDQGLTYLQTLEESDHPLSIEARLILGYFYLYPMNQPADAVRYFSKAQAEPAKNLLSLLLLATAHSKNHDGDVALKLMTGLPLPKWESLPMGFYLLGDLFLQKAQFEQARFYYLSFRNHYKGADFQKDVAAKIAASYLLEDESALAVEWRGRGQSYKPVRTAPDKNAEVFLEEMEAYPHELLMARLATDGGYYPEARQLLRRYQPTKNRRWSCEYHYRIARLHHLQKQYTEALSAYQSAVEISEGENWYVGANAALLAGDIFTELGNKQEAAVYYQKAMDYKDHAYKESIDQQAKRALALLGGK